MAILLTGCPPRQERPFDDQPGPALPVDSAVRIVNDNLSRIDGTLRAMGPVDGTVTTTDGRTQSFHVEGILFYLPRRTAPGIGPHLRFDLKKLGDTQLLLGSNESRYWYFVREDDAWECAWHADESIVLDELPVKPRELVDALGLTPIPVGLPGPGDLGRIQRIVGKHQQLLFLQEGDRAGMKLRKEYWLDRFPPRLIGRVVFRDDMGDVEMESDLTDYRPIAEGGAWLPHEMSASWPGQGLELRFRIRRWESFPHVTATSVQFATPDACRDE